MLTRAYYGLNDTKRHVVMSMFEVALNIILLVKRFGIIGVVGATVIVGLVFIVMMLVNLGKCILGYYIEMILQDAGKGILRTVRSIKTIRRK